MKQKEPQVEALHSRLEQLMELGGPDDASVQKLQRDFDHFTEKWAHVVERISKLRLIFGYQMIALFLILLQVVH